MPVRAARSRRAPGTASRTTGAQLANRFRQWLEIRKETDALAERQEQLRIRMLADIEAHPGYTDDKGSQFIDLPEPMEFTDAKGKSFKYTAVKRERVLTPAESTPDAERAAEILRDKGLYLSDAQILTLLKIQKTNPYVRISVEVDTDAFTGAYYRDLISEAEYSSSLIEQTETWRFQKCE